MPLLWKRGQNPYVENYFRLLRAGPDVLPTQVVQLADNLRRQIGAGRSVELGGRSVSITEIQEASAKLRDARCLAEERLLAHAVPSVSRAGAADTGRCLEELLSLLSPASGDGLAELKLVRPGDAVDRASDIVFDV